jgi:hypothetical protein
VLPPASFETLALPSAEAPPSVPDVVASAETLAPASESTAADAEQPSGLRVSEMRATKPRDIVVVLMSVFDSSPTM